MRRVIGTALATLLAMAVATAAWADCTGEQTNAHAQMKCCANGHRQCAKNANPHDCCKQLRDAGSSSALATAAVPFVKVPVVHGVVELLTAPSVIAAYALTVTPSPEFKRPHDPPYLHPFALLI
jgi:hypothetical protein